MEMALSAKKQFHLDRILFLPTGNPPHKREGLADAEDRFEMTRLAVWGLQGCTASRMEIDREGVIYTVDTLTNLKAQMPDAQLFYLIGADTVHQLRTWRRVEDVIRLCAFLVMMRPGEDEAATLEAMAAWRERGAQMTLLEGRLEDVSSSEIRALLGDEQSASHLLPQAVLQYIRTHQLYQTGDQA